MYKMYQEITCNRNYDNGEELSISSATKNVYNILSNYYVDLYTNLQKFCNNLCIDLGLIEEIKDD